MCVSTVVGQIFAVTLALAGYPGILKSHGRFPIAFRLELLYTGGVNLP